MPFRDADRSLRDIVDAIETIDRFTAGMDFAAFREDPKTVAAVERKLRIVSEAAIRLGSERSFLFQTALRVAADSRRTRLRRREVAASDIPENDEESDRAPSPEDAVDLRRARMWLDAILDEMSLDLRAAFVLFELDQMTMAEISVLLDLPPGTVASRLRRARHQFREKVARMAETLKAGEGGAA